MNRPFKKTITVMSDEAKDNQDHSLASKKIVTLTSWSWMAPGLVVQTGGGVGSVQNVSFPARVLAHRAPDHQTLNSGGFMLLILHGNPDHVAHA